MAGYRWIDYHGSGFVHAVHNHGHSKGKGKAQAAPWRFLPRSRKCQLY